jgi:transposase-like protein
MKWTTEVVCPICKSNSAMRINRNGFLQRRVLGIFGFYPWKCGSCGSVFLYRKRGQRHSSKSEVSESHSTGREQGEA